MLLILALTLYLTDIYIDIIFMFIGVTLGILTTGIIFVKTYFWLIIIAIISLVTLNYSFYCDTSKIIKNWKMKFNDNNPIIIVPWT